jgi:ABC-type microcin C transport system permease subunit YejE
VFPVRYELNVYILFGRNSVFKGLSKSNVYNSMPLDYVNPASQLAAHALTIIFNNTLPLNPKTPK